MKCFTLDNSTLSGFLLLNCKKKHVKLPCNFLIILVLVLHLKTSDKAVVIEKGSWQPKSIRSSWQPINTPAPIIIFIPNFKNFAWSSNKQILPGWTRARRGVRTTSCSSACPTTWRSAAGDRGGSAWPRRPHILPLAAEVQKFKLQVLKLILLIKIFKKFKVTLKLKFSYENVL